MNVGAGVLMNSAKSDASSFPRLLIVSHNPLSRVNNNGKTLLSFFKGWPKESLFQLYLTLDYPDFEVAGSYFRISDNDILRSVLDEHYVPGQIIQREEYSSQSDTQEKQKLFYRVVRFFFVNRVPLALVIRTLLWRKGAWKNEKLDAWLAQVAPDVVFFQSSNVSATFDLVSHICHSRCIPLFMQTTDDYLGARISIDPFFWLYRHDMNKTYRAAVQKAEMVVVIGEKMRAEYASKFAGQYFVAMNSVEVDKGPTRITALPTKRSVVVSYFGNLGLGRLETIVKLAHNMKHHGFNFRVYSMMKPSKRQYRKIKSASNLQFMGGVINEEFDIAVSKADILLHVESFRRRQKHITRLSLSTKIPEYLASGKTVLACGPSDIASIDYLLSTYTAVVITKLGSRNVEKAVAELRDTMHRKRMIDCALKTARDNHDVETIREHLTAAITASVG